MRYSFTDEQLQLRDTLRRFLSEVSPPTEVRKLMETEEGFDRKVWERIHEELGIGGIHISSDHGGAGLSFVELAIVLEEMGRALLCAPYLSSCVFASTVIATLGSQEQQAKYLPDLVSGKKIGTVALYEDASTFEPSTVALKFSGGLLTGRKTLVSDGNVADIILVLAQDVDMGDSTYCVVDSNDSSVRRHALTTMDWTRKLSEIEFDSVPAERLGSKDDISNQLDYIFNVQITALANEMVGGAEQLLESAISYSKERVQFGRSISSLQAIKHKCAETLLEVEFAKSAAYRAAQAIAENDENLGEYCSTAKAVANEAYMRAATECIQIHGGIGFTWENDTHLWFKRAKSSEVFLGNTQYHRERYLTEMGL